MTAQIGSAFFALVPVLEGVVQMDNARSLPHDSRNGHHLDLYTYREGEVKPIKLHEPIDGPKVDVRSIDALRQRLDSTKGY